MPLEIKIYTILDPERGERAQLEASMEALGFVRQAITRYEKTDEASVVDDLYSGAAEVLNAMRTKEPEPDIVAEQQADVAQAQAATIVTNTPRAGETPEQTAARRERGKPSPGAKRRTKEEIAEDDAAEKAEAGIPATEPQAISTGEERVGPDDEAVAQDAADEADEAAATASEGPTHDDLRKALGKLGIKAGVEAVKPGGLIGMTVDQVPQDQIAAVIAKIEAAKGSAPETKAEEPAPAQAAAAPSYPPTRDGLMKAMLAYALKFDGTDDPTKASAATMPATMEDAPKVFAMRFGEAVNSLSKVPADQYAQAIADIVEATEKNPFGRAVK